MMTEKNPRPSGRGVVNTIIADLVDDRNRMSAALHRIVFEAASYSDCVAIAKDFIGAGILPYPPQTVAVSNGEE